MMFQWVHFLNWEECIVEFLLRLVFRDDLRVTSAGSLALGPVENRVDTPTGLSLVK